jgi:hypothetical protein
MTTDAASRLGGGEPGSRPDSLWTERAYDVRGDRISGGQGTDLIRVTKTDPRTAARNAPR